MSLIRKSPIKKKGSEKSYGAVESPTLREQSEAPSHRSATDQDPLPKLQKQVNEVKDILKDNIEKVVERDHKVGTLVDRTENLRNTSTLFRDNATQLRKDTQRRNWKLTCCIVVVILVILAIVTIVVLYALKVI